MEPSAAALSGGAAGLAGAALAHVLATLAGRHGAADWLRGSGPPFFGLALYSGVFYGAIGAAAGRRALTLALGFGVAFLGLLIPLSLLARGTRVAGPAAGTTVVVVYAAALWGTISALGAAAARTRPWRGALAAVLGSLAAYATLSLTLKLVPGYGRTPWDPTSLVPSPVNLLDGLLSGAGLCLALSLDERLAISRRTS